MRGYDNPRFNHELLLDLQFCEGTGTVTLDWAKAHHEPNSLVNTPTWTNLANDLTTLDFDAAASEHIVTLAADSGDLNFTTGDFSGIVWFCPDMYGSRVIFNKSNGTTGWSLSITSGDQHVYFTTRQAGPTLQHTYGAAELAINAWQLVGFTRSGTVARIYLNGRDRTTTPATHVDPATAGQNFYIGCTDLAAGSFIDGTLWRPRVWGRCLTAAEMLAVYEAERGLFGV